MTTHQKVTEIVNGCLHVWKLQELSETEAFVLSLFFFERHQELENLLINPIREECWHSPTKFIQTLMMVSDMLMADVLDQLFAMRGIESIYCLKGRNYHEDREGD